MPPSSPDVLAKSSQATANLRDSHVVMLHWNESVVTLRRTRFDSIKANYLGVSQRVEQVKSVPFDDGDVKQSALCKKVLLSIGVAQSEFNVIAVGRQMQNRSR